MVKNVPCQALNRFLDEPISALAKLTGRNDAIRTRNISMYRIGAAGFHDLVEIRYPYKREQTENPPLYDSLRLTLVGVENEVYCPIIAVEQQTSSSVLNDASKLTTRLVTVGLETFVESLVRVSGTGNFHEQHYFRMAGEEFLEMDLVEQADTLARPLFPPGTENRKGASFDLQSLRWRSGAWLPSDPNCCPSRGGVFIQFRLNRHHLEVMEYELFADWEALMEKE